MPGSASQRLLAPSVSPEGILGHGLHCEQGAFEESKEKQWLPVLRVRSSDSSAQTRGASLSMGQYLGQNVLTRPAP
jgi:hypothetical protein